MKYTLFYDTNALLSLQDKAFEEHFFISQKTLEEIENIKSSSKKDGEIKWKARKTARLLDDKNENYTVILINSEIKKIVEKFDLDETPDNLILASAYFVNFNLETPVIVVSDDINVKFLSREVFQLYTKSIDDLRLVDSEEYIGYKEVEMTEEEMSFFYSNIERNIYDLLANQYLVIKDKNGEIVDRYKWTGSEHKHISYERVRSQYTDTIEPINDEQVLAFDMLQDFSTTINVITGKWGSGKSLLLIAHALDMIRQGKADKMIYIRNPVEVKDSKELGYLPGTLEEKMGPFTAAIADHIGGEIGLMYLMDAGSIEIEHLGFIRGRTFDNCIVVVSEAENMTRQHIQLIISRIGKNSQLWIDGAYDQVDSPTFRLNNGLISIIDRLKGHPRFGFVKLNKTERSEVAELASLLD